LFASSSPPDERREQGAGYAEVRREKRKTAVFTAKNRFFSLFRPFFT